MVEVEEEVPAAEVVMKAAVGVYEVVVAHLSSWLAEMRHLWPSVDEASLLLGT